MRHSPVGAGLVPARIRTLILLLAVSVLSSPLSAESTPRSRWFTARTTKVLDGEKVIATLPAGTLVKPVKRAKSNAAGVLLLIQARDASGENVSGWALETDVLPEPSVQSASIMREMGNSFLVGLILAFVGAVQLERSDAQIYVADLVGRGAREPNATVWRALPKGRSERSSWRTARQPATA